MLEEDEVASLEQKFSGCGIKTVTVNGHDICDLINVLSVDYQGPVVIVADTVKGKGVSFMESGIKWHHSVPKQKQYEIAIQELEGSVDHE